MAPPMSSTFRLALDVSEKVALATNQMLKKLEDDAQVSSLTLKIYRAQYAKLELRLTPELASLYSHGFDGVRPTIGMEMFEERRGC